MCNNIIIFLIREAERREKRDEIRKKYGKYNGDKK